MKTDPRPFIAAAVAGLCQHSAAKAHYDVGELGARAVDIGLAVAKAFDVALEKHDAEEHDEAPPIAKRAGEPAGAPPAPAPAAEAAQPPADEPPPVETKQKKKG